LEREPYAKIFVESAARKEALTVLRRLISYDEEIFSLSATLLAPLADRRVALGLLLRR
jgi:hypothetical protein